MKTDARVKYTQKTLKNALVKIMEKKAINKITVKEVCELAELNRATFYTHYADCYDLMDELERDVLQEYAMSLDYLNSFDVSEMIRAIYDMIEKNIDLCKVLIFKNPNGTLLKKMMQIPHESSIKYWKEHLKKAGDNELEMLFTFLSNGLVSVIIDGYEKYDKEKLIAFVNTMTQNSLKAYV